MVLWDFLFAYGVHWNVLAVVAQVLLIREQVLASDTCVYASCLFRTTPYLYRTQTSVSCSQP